MAKQLIPWALVPIFWCCCILPSLFFFCCLGCPQQEKAALLDFKEGLHLENSVLKLESWKGLNCCAWEGVSCHLHTGHVISLDLSARLLSRMEFVEAYPPYLSWGQVRAGLFQLSRLEHLDLSVNDFTDLAIPSELGNLTKLRFLNLADCGFRGQIPDNISRLQQLEHLDLQGNEIHGAIPNEIAKLSSLKFLDLSWNLFDGSVPREIGNISSLTFLDLSYNGGLEGSNLDEWIKHLRGLKNLGLGWVNLTVNGDKWGEEIVSLSNLNTLHMLGCGLSGVIPLSIANLSKLEELDLSHNSLRGKIPAFGGPLPLSYDEPSSKSFKGSDPSYLSALSRLSSIDLSSNSLSGTIPTSFANLHKLTYLVLAENKLEGTFEFSLLDNLTRMVFLDLSDNILTVKISPLSIPNFQLRFLDLHSCNVEGKFPDFISTQYSIYYLDLSSNSLNGNIPNWLWDSSSLFRLNLSSNQFVGKLSAKFLGFEQRSYFEDEDVIIDLHKNSLEGNIPLPYQDVQVLDLSENLFSGSIPAEIGKKGQGLTYLSLAKNNFTDVIPESLCEAEKLIFLDLSNNKLGGRIPTGLKSCSQLSLLNLERNNFEGELSDVFGGMTSLQTLKLGHNGLKGQMTPSLANCSSLKILDLRNNNLQGNIPNWIERLHNLEILVLKFNKFVGKIPSQLGKLQNLQILDISNNQISGVIPGGFMNLTAMANLSENTVSFKHNYSIHEFVDYLDKIVIRNKGQDMEFESFLRLVKGLDLSSNNLSGHIPWDIGSLKGLIILNISRNLLSGKIPKSLGSMVQLESLDLSQNELSGNIVELQFLTYLSFLDVSHNNLSGIIPQSGQMMTFEASSFSNNSGLCGLQINVSCSRSSPAPPKNNEENNEDLKMDIWWYVGVAVCYVFGFSLMIWVLYFSSWSVKCFKIMDDIIINLFQR